MEQLITEDNYRSALMFTNMQVSKMKEECWDCKIKTTLIDHINIYKEVIEVLIQKNEIHNS